jgi:hypothetical protein
MLLQRKYKNAWNYFFDMVYFMCESQDWLNVNNLCCHDKIKSHLL